MIRTQLHLGKCEEILPKIESNSIDMVFTSPPYAEQRKNCYKSIPLEKYIEWFYPIAKELRRVLKPTGSFFLNLKAHIENGERHLYVMELVIFLKKIVDFRFVDEFQWNKNAFPGGYKGRFKNAFEPIYHFTKGDPRYITFNPLACGTSMKPESLARAYRKQCGMPKNGSGMGAFKGENLKKLKLARPSNVIKVNNVSNQFSKKQKHPATFPEGLVNFFVKSFTNEGDRVLDPFMGSGTTGIVCRNLRRNFTGIDVKEEYHKLSTERIFGND
jgi:DNA modification methylase